VSGHQLDFVGGLALPHINSRWREPPFWVFLTELNNSATTWVRFTKFYRDIKNHSHWVGAGAPQSLRRPSPNLNTRSALRRFAPAGSRASLGTFKCRSLLGTFGPSVVQERTSAGQNFFQTMPVGVKFWSRFAWILLKMHKMWEFDSQEIIEIVTTRCHILG